MPISRRGCPRKIRIDNGPEFISHRLAALVKEHCIHILARIQLDRPVQNSDIEPFNRTYREDVLDTNLFSSLDEVREITEQ